MASASPQSAAPASPPLPALKALKPFVAGGIAGCVATSFVQPLDLVKVRLQIAGQGQRLAKPPSALATGISIIKTEGPAALWTGLSAGLLRQVVYGASRLGLFRTFSDAAKERRQGAVLPLWEKLLLASSAGGIASALGNPADLALVRMQADSTLPAAQRAHYTGVVDTLRRVAKADGVLGWWRGSTPTVVRAVLLNAGMLATNDECSERFAPVLGKGSLANQVVSAAISGVVASAASLPADLVRVRLQKMTPDPATGKLPYSGFLNCALSIARQEGFRTFWRGLGTYTTRISPHVVITLLLLPHTTSLVGKLTG